MFCFEKIALMDGGDKSSIFASFTRHIVVIWSYKHYMFDTPKLRMYTVVNKHVYQMQVIFMMACWIFVVNINS